MKVIERNKATELRRRGWTLREIAAQVPVSRGSLSYWLRDIVLTPDQLDRIKYKNQEVKEKFIKFNNLRKEQSAAEKKAVFRKAASQIQELSINELKLVGIALYWAEGYKGAACGGAEFTNTDPAMVKLMMQWFRRVCCVPESKFRIRIQLHDPTNIGIATRYWSRVADIPISQFTKPYLKISPTSRQKIGNVTPYGTCCIRVSDIRLLTKIRGWIQGFYGAIV